MKLNHDTKVKKLQEKVGQFAGKSPLSWSSSRGYSNTTRPKSYKQGHENLDLSQFDQIISIDPENRVIHVEPRVTMEALVQALLPYRLMVPVVPEFKGITVGGAIMGAGAESSSFKWGCFHDACLSYEILCGDGNVKRVTPQENPALFYGMAGSYGSFGLLLSAEIKLIPIQDYVQVRTHAFTDPLEALKFLKERSQSDTPPDFLDGIICHGNLACIMEGYFQTRETAPQFSLKKRSSKWFAQHIQEIAVPGKIVDMSMSTYEYLFRYDLGVFWMAAYLLRLPLMARFASQGYFKLLKAPSGFNEEEVKNFHHLQYPGFLKRALFHPFMHSQHLWNLLHHAEKWVEKRTIIQDFCIPEKNVEAFFSEIKQDPGIFPLWLCPIKGTRHPQIFAPHLLPENLENPLFINFGIYGIPSGPSPMNEVLKRLEQLVKKNQGRKVLYSHSEYSEEEFWQIYSRKDYERLRNQTGSDGIWHSITEKLLE